MKTQIYMELVYIHFLSMLAIWQKDIQSYTLQFFPGES